jgi:hypothetical protein
MDSMDAPKEVPNSIPKVRPVILVRQSAMSVATGVSLPVSPEGTKVMMMGLSGEPSAPAAGVRGFAIGAQAAGGTVGVGGKAVAVGGTAVAVGGTAVAVDGIAVAVGGIAVSVGAGGLVGAGGFVGAGAAVVAAGPQAERVSMASTITIITRRETTVFFIFSPLIMGMKICGAITCTRVNHKSKFEQKQACHLKISNF